MTTARKMKKNLTSSKAVQKKTKKASNLNAAEVREVKKILSNHIPARDRTQFHNHDLEAISGSFWEFAQERKPGQLKLRVINPSYKKDGYISRHSIIMVINDDMPFLVDSAVGELNQMGLGVHLVVHPVCSVSRDATGKLIRFNQGKDTQIGHLLESWMYIEIDETPSAEKLDAIAKNLEGTFRHVRFSVHDWEAMRHKVMETIRELPGNERARLPAGESEETAEFLAWLEADNFTFLGARDYHVSGQGDKMRLVNDKQSGLGILRDPISVMFFSGEEEGVQPSDMHVFLARKQITFITKTHRCSKVHRTTPMDAILIKRYSPQGVLVGERLFVGLFTSASYNSLPKDVPVIRGKIAYVLDRAGLNPRSHDGKALAHILNSYPRDELFQISQEELLQTTIGILQLQERQNLALFIRQDVFNRFVHCLVFVPREFFSTKLRKQFQAILMKTFNGTAIEFNSKITNEPLAQIFFVVRASGGHIPAYNKQELERSLQEAARGWDGRLRNELIASFGENRGLELAHIYGDAFPDGYCDNFTAREALKDIIFIEEVRQHGGLELDLYRSVSSTQNTVNLKWFNPARALSLSRILPLMHAMGLEPDAMQGPYCIRPKNAETPIWVHDCLARTKGTGEIDVYKIKEKFEDCLARMWGGDIEVDGFNQLVLLADLSWREIVILRAIGKYLRQARLPYSEQAIIEALGEQPQIAQLLAQLFIARHDPAATKDSAKITARIEKQITDALQDVRLIDQDRILRRILNVIQQSLRTNYFQVDKNGNAKPYLSIKLDSRHLDGLPLPRPHVEVFVYSPKTEAIHLRGGKVARGGIRWSDRREDFRTEVLGLMKAQQVKNTVIVPVGSKGGFIVKVQNPTDMAAEGIACYRIMMQGLLDITDNRVGEKIVKPKQVTCYDGDDPYLVVAADKGTAKFSDIANAISLEYGFWLGDAFASGGSAGYDHKEMAITARGAWEAVKRHFREIGIDIQRQPFTVIGVGDMAGDVFGNGMLLSHQIKLIGAFNHKHIFIDPAPDPAASFRERQRLFNLPGSQWSDYSKKQISKGGGVYSRDAKSIRLSKEARQVLDLTQEEITPDNLIQALLKARTDLLWFGGIGTYVKAEEESHADVGDRANDNLRINADSLRALVIGEGANLGMTQRGRVAYALRKGRLNTDAIDNSAGVDTSDHEVNIKILLDPLVQSGKLDLKARNQLLAKMTDDVATHVLRDNYLQTLALSITQARGLELTPMHARLMQQLERSGLLNRRVEFLPDEETLMERQRAGHGLTRPELAVLMAYAKIALYDELLASSLPDNPGLQGELALYFPPALRERYADAMRSHRLRREIVATSTTNSVINRGGIHFVYLIHEKTGKSAADIATAFAVVRDVYQLRQLWRALEMLDNQVSAAVLAELYARINKMIERTTPWYVQYAALDDTAALVAKHRKAVDILCAWMEKESSLLAREEDTKRWEEYAKQGIPEKVIRQTLSLPLLGHVPEIVGIADRTKQPLTHVAEVYFAVEARLHLFWLRTHARHLNGESIWQRDATSYLVDDLYRIQAMLTRSILCHNMQQTKKPVAAGKKQKKTPGKPLAKLTNPVTAIENWAGTIGISLQSYDQLLASIMGSQQVELAMLNLVLRQLQLWASENFRSHETA